MVDDRTPAELIDVIAELLDEPLTIVELAELLIEGEHIDGSAYDELDDLVDELESYLSRYEGIWTTGTGLLVLDEDLVHGVTFSHRLTADELATGMVAMNPDLAALQADVAGALPLVGGGELDIAYDETDDGADPDGSLVGPPGWLDRFTAGDILTFTREPDGVRVDRVDDVGDGDHEVAQLRQALANRIPARDVGEAAFAVVYDALAESPDCFTDPVRPLGELLTAAGIEVRGDWVGTAGVDWRPPAISTAALDRDVLADRYEFGECCLEAFDGAMAAWNHLVLPENEGIDWPEVVELLRHGNVAPAFADYVLRDLDERHPVLDELVDVLRAVGGRADAPASYLAARNLERGGDVLAAETALQSALRADPSFVPALDELAWYVADRGDAEQAVNLLRRAGYDSDDAELSMLEALRPRRNAVGRNERCPCGSGRKYKDCCQRNARLPLVERGDWLVQKVWTFVLRPHHVRHVMALTALIADGDEDVFDELLDVGLPMDLAAFDDDLARAFLVERGPLLPDDEREVLAAWTREPRTLWEVVEHEPGAYLALRGAVHDRSVVIATPPDAKFEPGRLLYTRVGSIGDRYRFVGVPLDLDPNARGSVEALIASQPDAWKIARWFAQMTRG
jgi:hypothetical protein